MFLYIYIVCILPEAALYNNILLAHCCTYTVPSEAYIIIFYNTHGRIIRVHCFTCFSLVLLFFFSRFS